MKPRARRVLSLGIFLVLVAILSFLVVRRTASLRTIYEFETRWWFLELKLRGDVPDIGWGEALRRVGPGWAHRQRFDVARVSGDGAAPCPVHWETPLGRFWATERDGRELDLLTLEQGAGDIYEQRDVRVRDSDIVMDVGAHLGTFTRIALKRGARLVVAIEPDPVNAACFGRTFAPEIAAGRVRLVQAAAWHSPGSLEFEVGGASQTGHVANAHGGGGLLVPAVTLDGVMDEMKLGRVDFIKMDIEGAERHALTGARRLLVRHKPRLAICIYHSPDDPEVIPRLIREANSTYRTFNRHGFQAYFH